MAATLGKMTLFPHMEITCPQSLQNISWVRGLTHGWSASAAKKESAKPGLSLYIRMLGFFFITFYILWINTAAYLQSNTVYTSENERAGFYVVLTQWSDSHLLTGGKKLAVGRNQGRELPKYTQNDIFLTNKTNTFDLLCLHPALKAHPPSFESIHRQISSPGLSRLLFLSFVYK